MYDGSGPADEEDDEDEEERPAREAELESALSRAERDSIASRQGKLRAGFDGAGRDVSAAEDDEAAAEAGDDEDDEDENEDESRIVEAGLGGDRSGRCSRRPANRRA